MTVFLTATTDLQQSPAYEQALALLKERHGESEISLDRNLFDSFREWRKSYKEVYGKAEVMYVLAREDGTVGLGIYKQCRFADRKGILTVLMFADEHGELAFSGENEEEVNVRTLVGLSSSVGAVNVQASVSVTI